MYSQFCLWEIYTTFADSRLLETLNPVPEAVAFRARRVSADVGIAFLPLGLHWGGGAYSLLICFLLVFVQMNERFWVSNTRFWSWVFFFFRFFEGELSNFVVIYVGIVLLMLGSWTMKVLKHVEWVKDWLLWLVALVLLGIV